MAHNLAAKVRGMSLPEFIKAFGTEEQCRQALVEAKWPKGFICPSCGHRGHSVLKGRRGLFQCNRCKRQVSPTAGTLFHATKLPLTTWFLAMHLVATSKNGISSVELGRHIGLKQQRAWKVKQKIMHAMERRERDLPLRGRVEMDDAYLGGVRPGGKRGRGAAGKTPFVALVSTTDEGVPICMKMVPVKGFRKREIRRGAPQWLDRKASVVTDALSCWGVLGEEGFSHETVRTGGGPGAARMTQFWCVNTALGNIKSAITGTYRKLGPGYADRYLASFAWRYNRRYSLEEMVPCLVQTAALTPPITYKQLLAG